jgi:hypothetical protein
MISVAKAWRLSLATTRRIETVIFCYVVLSFDDGRELKDFIREGMIDDTTIVE